MDDLLGTKTTLRLQMGEVIEGWHYAENRLGYYLALDSDGRIIRFVPFGEWQSAGYDHKSPRAQFRPQQFDNLLETYAALKNELRSPMRLAFERLDINHVRRLATRIQDIRRDLHRYRVYQEAPLPIILAARDSHEALLDEIARSGVRDVLLERRNQIREVVSEFTLPQIDAYYIYPYELNLMIQLTKEEDHLAETNLGKTPLQKLTADALATPQGDDQSNDQSEELPDESSDKKRKRKAHRLRSAAAWLKVSSGGGLAAANLTLGALAGAISALPTLGMGTVAAAVGIAASTFTGLNVASDALKDMASNLEQKQ